MPFFLFFHRNIVALKMSNKKLAKRLHVIWIHLYPELTANIHKGLSIKQLNRKLFQTLRNQSVSLARGQRRHPDIYSFGSEEITTNLVFTWNSCFYFFSKLLLIPNYSWKKQSYLFLLDNKICDTEWKQVKNWGSSLFSSSTLLSGSHKLKVCSWTISLLPYTVLEMGDWMKFWCLHLAEIHALHCYSCSPFNNIKVVICYHGNSSEIQLLYVPLKTHPLAFCDSIVIWMRTVLASFVVVPFKFGAMS